MFLFFIIVGFFVININLVRACSCITPSQPKESLEKSTAVFVGKVMDINIPSGFFMSSGDKTKVEFEISKFWKGPSYKNIALTTARDGASCGYSFKKGEEYIVYAYDDENKLNTDLCTRTKLISNAREDLTALGEGKNPDMEGLKLPAQSSTKKILLLSFGSLTFLVISYFFAKKYKK